MKKLLFLSIILLINKVSIAQIDTFKYATQNLALHHMWGNLDTSEIETGILIDKFPSINNSIVYQNRTLNDSTITLNHWISFYNSLYWGKNDTIRTMPNVNELIAITDSLGQHTASIPLGMLNFNYNKLKDSALVLNLIQLVDNHKFYRAASSSIPLPYYSKTVFSISPVYIVCNSLSVCFSLDSSMVFTNRKDTIQKFEVKYDVDSTYTEFYMNTVFCTRFSNYGNQTLNFRCITNNNDTFYCNTVFTIKEIDNSERSGACGDLIEPDEGPTILSYMPGLPGSYYNHLPNPYPIIKARYAVWHGCNLSAGPPNATLVRKPILFVTGFNPKNSKTMLCWENDEAFQNHFPQNWLSFAAEKIWRGSYYETFNGATWPDFRGIISNTTYWDQINGNNAVYNNLKMLFNNTGYLQKLRENGFDIWIMAVENGEDKAQNNALLVAKMINLINNHYLSLGQNEELIVTGYSAGAWSSRFALTMMEKYHNENLNTPNAHLYPHHRTKLWLSYEGEFYGANTPIGFQEFVKFMAATFNPDLATTVVGAAYLAYITGINALLVGGLTPFIDNAILSQTNEILNNPASQQLSRYVPGYGTGRSTAANQLNSDIYALNTATRGYPAYCRKISLAQGSGVGFETTNGGNYSARFPPEGIMFEVEQKPYLPLTVGVLPARFATSRWNKNGASTIFRGKTGFRTFLLGIPISFVQTGTETIIAGNYKGWDYCPGSTQATANIMYNNLGFMKDPINIFNTFNYNQTMHSFAPTAGMFDIRTPASGYTLEENVFENLDDKYRLFVIRKDLSNNTLIDENFKRYGYPHLSHPNDHKLITPFDAVAAVGDPTFQGYNTFLPNHFHVDDFQDDFLPFLMGEMADEDVYVQNRDIGNNTPNYMAGFHAKNIVYCGRDVYQKYCNEWRDKEGDVIIDQGTQVELRGADIVFSTGVSIIGGGGLHAHLGYTGNCTQDMSQRNGLVSEYSSQNGTNSDNQSSIKLDNIYNKELNFNVSIYPNPKAKDESFNVEIKGLTNAVCEVYDLTGRIIHNENIFEGKNSISLIEKSSTLLIIKITSNENKTFYSKLAIY